LIVLCWFNTVNKISFLFRVRVLKILIEIEDRSLIFRFRFLL